MFSISVDNIVLLLKNPNCLALSLVFLIIGFSLGVALFKVWFYKSEENIKNREKMLDKKEKDIEAMISENKVLKDEISKIKENPKYWIENVNNGAISEKSDIYKL